MARLVEKIEERGNDCQMWLLHRKWVPAHGEMKDKTKTNNNKKGERRRRQKERRKKRLCLLAAEAGHDQFVCSFVYGCEDGE